MVKVPVVLSNVNVFIRLTFVGYIAPSLMVGLPVAVHSPWGFRIDVANRTYSLFPHMTESRSAGKRWWHGIKESKRRTDDL